MKSIKKKSMFLLLPLAFMALTGCDADNSSNSTAGGSQGSSDTSTIESEFAVTIEAVENGTVTANKEKAKVGEDVEFTITVNEGYYVKSFLVNDVEVALTENKAIVKMVDGGLKAKLIVTDSYPASKFDADLKQKIKDADQFKVALTADTTVDALPLAKDTTEYDLGGKTLTVDGKMALSAAQGQSITIKNGSVAFTGTADPTELKDLKANLFEVSSAKLFVLDHVAVTVETAMTTAIYCSSSTDLRVLHSTIDLKNAYYGLGTNNSLGANAHILIQDSSVNVTNAEKNNTAFLGNVEGLGVQIENSSFKADRQAIIARTGSWMIENTTAEITGDWLKDAGNATKNNGYLTGTWKTDNEVPSAPVVVGDTNNNAYDESVYFNARGTEFVAPTGNNKVVTRQDGSNKYFTKITMDSATYKNAKDGLDNGSGVSISLADNGETLTDLTATIEVGEGGTASLSKTTGITYGEKVDVTVTPTSGYKVNKVTLTGIDGAETDITAAMSFNAGLKNTVKVEFAVLQVGGTQVVARDLFPDATDNVSPTSGTFTAKGFTFAFTERSSVSLKIFRPGTTTPYDVPYLQAAKGAKIILSEISGKIIKKIEFVFAVTSGNAGGPDYLNSDDGYYVANSDKTGVWENKENQSRELTFKVGKTGATGLVCAMITSLIITC